MNFYDGKEIKFSYTCDKCKDTFNVIYNFPTLMSSEIVTFAHPLDDKYINPTIERIIPYPEEKRIEVYFSFYCKNCGKNCFVDRMIFELRNNKFYPVVED